MHLNKDRIRQRFARAAATYDKQAVIQVKMAEKLLSLLGKYLAASPAKVLEIGCCTGLLTQRLIRKYQEMETFYVNDLVAEFRAMVQERLGNDPRLVFLHGDIEEVAIPEKLDLVVSSSTLHWLTDLPAFFRKLAAGLDPGATLCFSIYGPDNMRELRALTGIGLEYHSLDALREMVGSSFAVLACEEEREVLTFDDPLDLLDHLRETGVNALGQPPWTRSRLESFRQEYTACFSSGNQVVLTYHPIYFIARKKADQDLSR